jgi:hypothetical protein
MNGASSADSIGDEHVRDHPLENDLYDFFASRGAKLDPEIRQRIAIHIALCGQCAITGEFMEETEESLDAQLPIPLSEEDQAGLEKSLRMVRVITAEHPGDVPASQSEFAKQWIPISIKDFFYFRWSTVTGRLQLIATSLLVVVAGSLLGYGVYNLGVSTISHVNRRTEQLPDRTISSTPELAQASPQPTTVPPAPSPSPQWLVKTNKPQRPLRETFGKQMLAHLNAEVNLERLREGLYRGGGNRPRSHPTIHALMTGPTRVRIRLPDGSASGSYSVAIEDPYFHPVAPPAKGESPDGKELTVSLELRGLAEQSYYLGIAPEGGAPVHYQVRLKITKSSSSEPKPVSPRSQR